MKKLLIKTLILLMLTLTACGSASDSSTAGSEPSAGSMPIATQLIIGTMKLDGTEQDITPKQAAELLPMWQVYSELLTSDTAAQAEIDGLLVQIQETMTNEQTQAIEDMNLSQRDVMTVMQEQGLMTAPSGQSGSSSSSSGNSSGFTGPPDGGGMGMPAGGPPDGGGGMPGGMPVGGNSSGTGDTTSKESIQSPMGGGLPSALIDALIELLKSKAGS